ncbi:MAG TPA: radical SAM protein [Phycisphaerae bacterium]|nr:radical SAM protein [Phycisphaerae bacterium]HRY68028.1 radical SAM protein [Phycisphaerae bacterium]HSA28692.1 radical SAM protein [Phycisphaerae bacterium]
MRVLFIYPNLNAEEGFNHGVAVLSACLRARGHITGLININEALYDVPGDEQIVRQVREWQPDILAFSVMTQQYKYALRLARAARQALPALPIAIGGVHAIMCTEEVKKDGLWDYIGVGECDEALPELLNRLAAPGSDVRNVPNFCIRLPDGTYQQNPLGPYPDLNNLPAEDYEIFDLAHMLGRKNGWQSVLTSRGCPYRCTYCFNHEVTDRYLDDGGHPRRSYLRHYPVPRVIGELKELRRRHPYIETFILDDDLFTLNKSYCMDFVKAYTDAGVGVPLVLNAHVQTLTEPVAKVLSESPCMIVKFGVESGSEALRKKILERHMTNQAIADAFDLCHQYGLHTSAFLMFGLPYETRAMMEETIDLMARIRPGRMRWAIFFPFPGTKSYTICKLGNLIDYRKMDAMDNYFCASCLKFDAPTDLYIRKLQRTFHWRVNARAGFPLSSEYARRVEDVDRMDAAAWTEAGETVLAQDRTLSNGWLARVAPGDTAAMAASKHYSIRYTEVMAVDSDFVLAEKGDYKYLGARRWKAFREHIAESRAAGAVLKPADAGGRAEAVPNAAAGPDNLPSLRIVQSTSEAGPCRPIPKGRSRDGLAACRSQR